MLNLIPGMSGLGIYRWRMVLIIFFALLMALGAAYFITTMANRHPNKKRLGTAVMLVVCICIAVTSPVLLNSWDNDVQYTDAFTPKEYFYVDSDLSLFNYMSENIESGSTIYSDREHTKYSYHDSTSSIYYPYYSFSYQMMPMFEEIGAEINTQYLIFPEAKYQRTGIWILIGPESRALVTESKETTDIFNTNTYRYSTIYNNGDTMNYFSA